MQTLEKRFKELARSHRRWRGATVALSLVVLAALAMGQARPRDPVVAAEKFVLTDKQGREWAVLAMAEAGQPTLGFFDERGQPRASMGTAPDGASSLILYDGTGRPRVDVGVGKAGEPNLVMMDTNGKMRMFCGLQKDDTPLMTIFDAAEKPQYRLGRLPNRDHIGLSFIDEKGTARVGVSAAGLVVWGEKHTPVAALGGRGEGPALIFSNSKGEIRSVIGVNPEGSGSLFVVDKVGKTLMDVPSATPKN